MLPYIIVQVIGAVIAAGMIYCIASGKSDGSFTGGIAANGFGAYSPGGYTLASAFIIEVLLTGVFLFVIMGATHKDAPAGFAPIAIGLALTLIHLISIPVTNTSVNPARSTGPALIEAIYGVNGGAALSQVWLFWLAPIIGGALGAIIYRWLRPDNA